MKPTKRIEAKGRKVLRIGFTSYNAHSVYQNICFFQAAPSHSHKFSQIKMNLRFENRRFITFVGLSEFESETSCPPDKHANQLRYSPLLEIIISHLETSCKHVP